jgi:hypothetical protein
MDGYATYMSPPVYTLFLGHFRLRLLCPTDLQDEQVGGRREEPAGRASLIFFLASSSAVGKRLVVVLGQIAGS